MNRVALIVLPALICTSGCTVGPKYHAPRVQMPEAWKWQASESVQTQLSADWWHLFNDPRLAEFQQLARDANYDIQAAVARVDEARARAHISRADFYPSVSLSPVYARSQDSGNTFTPGSGGPIAGSRRVHNFFRVPADFSYEIDVWGRIRRTHNAAILRAEASVADFHAIQVTVASDVAANYFLIHAYDAEIAVLENTLKLRQESLKLVESKFKFGATDALDVARTRADIATNNAAIADAKRQREEIVNVLAILCAKPASALAVEFKPLAVQPPEVPAGLPSELLRRRPDVLQAERLLAATVEDIGVVKANFFPRFALTAAGGFESQELSNLFDPKSIAWQFALNLAQPVITGGRSKTEMEAAQARYNQALARYQQQVLVAFKDVEDALIEIKFRATQAKALGEAIEAAREVTRLATTKYEKGQISYLEVVDAQRRQLEAEQQMTLVLGQRLIAAVRLIKALGGGWTNEPQQPNPEAQKTSSSQGEK